MKTATATSTRTIWTLDPSHSEVLFKVKHLMISNVKGEFRKVNASIDMAGNDLSTASVRVNIDAGSIFTNDENRDKHLRSADFFDVEQHPHLHFTGTDMKHVGGNDYTLTGDLTIKGTTQRVTATGTTPSAKRVSVADGTRLTTRVTGALGAATYMRFRSSAFLAWNSASVRCP